MSEVTIEVAKREETGKNANRRTRSRGEVPGIVYGAGKDTVQIKLDRKTLVETLKKGGGGNAIFLLKLAGTDKSRHAMIREMQIDPVSRQIVHIDFQRIVLTEEVRVAVAIEVHGLAYGVKNEGAILDFPTRQVHVRCLPTQIPAKIEVDVTELHVNQHIEAKDLKLPEGVKLEEDPDRVIVSCKHERVVEEAPAAEALLEAAPAEPEVIKKGKVLEEGAEEKPEEKEKEKGKKK
jgi:large subunit ribosomal protein L25